MEIELKTVVTTSAKSLVESMSHEEIGEFCSYLAEKLDSEFTARNNAASEFSAGLSEFGCRFLAEVVCQHHYRNRNRPSD